MRRARKQEHVFLAWFTSKGSILSSNVFHSQSPQEPIGGKVAGVCDANDSSNRRVLKQQVNRKSNGFGRESATLPIGVEGESQFSFVLRRSDTHPDVPNQRSRFSVGDADLTPRVRLEKFSRSHCFQE